MVEDSIDGPFWLWMLDILIEIFEGYLEMYIIFE